eukprot:scaffold62224_cov65-Phaeocystis_antarctica.AAC.5
MHVPLRVHSACVEHVQGPYSARAVHIQCMCNARLQDDARLQHAAGDLRELQLGPAWPKGGTGDCGRAREAMAARPRRDEATAGHPVAWHFPQGVSSCPGPPGTPRGGAGAKLGH